jgi:hypothetical protein
LCLLWRRCRRSRLLCGWCGLGLLRRRLGSALGWWSTVSIAIAPAPAFATALVVAALLRGGCVRWSRGRLRLLLGLRRRLRSALRRWSAVSVAIAPAPAFATALVVPALLR